jgi:hypothetical protein
MFWLAGLIENGGPTLEELLFVGEWQGLEAELWKSLSLWTSAMSKEELS